MVFLDFHEPGTVCQAAGGTLGEVGINVAFADKRSVSGGRGTGR